MIDMSGRERYLLKIPAFHLCVSIEFFLMFLIYNFRGSNIESLQRDRLVFSLLQNEEKVKITGVSPKFSEFPYIQETT